MESENKNVNKSVAIPKKYFVNRANIKRFFYMVLILHMCNQNSIIFFIKHGLIEKLVVFFLY